MVHISKIHVYMVDCLLAALQVDVELAKQEANKPDEYDVELRKKLWLRIGK